jgi:hypothetical protein
MTWWNRNRQLLKVRLGKGILFSLRRGLWLSRLNAAIILLGIMVMYVWQYWSLASTQRRLELTRENVNQCHALLLHLEEISYEENKQFFLLQKADETFRAIQLLLGPKPPAEEVVNLSNIILEQSKLYGYDPLLIVAIIQVESQFRTTAHGKIDRGELSGPQGLMQIKPSTVNAIASELGMELSRQNLMDAETNVSWGIMYLTRLLLYYGDIRTAIIAYNMGIGKVESKLARGEILPKQYYREVMGCYDRLRNHM